MRFGKLILASALTACAAGCAKPPEGFRRLCPSFDARDYRVIPSGLVFLQDRYPNKTYLGVVDALTGKVRTWRFAERALERLVVSRDGRTAFVVARSLASADGERGAEQEALALSQARMVGAGAGALRKASKPSSAQAQEPAEEGAPAPRVLAVSLDQGKLLGEFRVPAGAALTAMAQPAWSGSLLMVLRMSDGRSFLRTWDPAAGEPTRPRPLDGALGKSVLFLDEEPWVASSLPAAGGARLTVWDVSSGKPLRSIELPADLRALSAASGARAVGVYELPGEDRGAVAEFDLRAGTQRELAQVDGEVESVLAAPSAVYATARNFSRPRDPKRTWLHPRDLLIIEDGRTSTLAWTQRSGEFLGYDASKDALDFVVNDADAPAFWLLPRARPALQAAGAALDRRYSIPAGMAVGVGLGIGLGLLFVFLGWSKDATEGLFPTR